MCILFFCVFLFSFNIYILHVLGKMLFFTCTHLALTCILLCYVCTLIICLSYHLIEQDYNTIKLNMAMIMCALCVYV